MSEPPDPALLAPDAAPSPPSTRFVRLAALLEVVLCSDFPTQLVVASTLAAFGLLPAADGSMTLTYITVLELADTVLLLGLIVFFVRAHGDSIRATFFGNRPLAPEARAGFPLIVVALGIWLAVMAATLALVPSLHTVPKNPLLNVLTSPARAVGFMLVLIVAGGVREEVQRAFLLQQFERHLGGARLGLVVTSVAFGAGHILQGADAALVTAMLGAFWGVVFLRRRSIGATVVSHAGFNVVQVLQFLAVGQ